MAWLLDTKIRKSTAGAKSLDDLMRLAYSRFSGTTGYTQTEFMSTAEEVAGTSLREFFHGYVETTEELDYSEALDWFGLRWKIQEPSKQKVSLGVVTKVDAGRLIIRQIPRGSAAAVSGLNTEDEILAIDDYRVRPEALAERLEQYQPGTEVLSLIHI